MTQPHVLATGFLRDMTTDPQPRAEKIHRPKQGPRAVHEKMSCYTMLYTSKHTRHLVIGVSTGWCNDQRCHYNI